MKQTLNFFLLLIAIIISGNLSAQTEHSYTDANGDIWKYYLNGSTAQIVDITGPNVIDVTVERKKFPGHYKTFHVYQRDILEVPSTVSDGTNTYTVTDFATNSMHAVRKVIIPATVTRLYLFHEQYQRVEFAPGSQLTSMSNLSLGGYLEEGDLSPLGQIIYYDFTGVNITGVTTWWYEIPDNTLLFTDVTSDLSYATLPYRRDFVGDDRKANHVKGGVCNQLKINDKEIFESPRSFTATQASYTRTFSNTAGKAVSTLYLPYPTDLPTGMQAYEFIFKGLDEDGNKAFCFAPVPLGTRLEAYHPYLVRITDGASHTLPTMHNVQVPVTPAISTTARTSGDGDWAFYGTTMFIGNTEAYARKAYYLNGNKWWAVQNGVTNDYIAPYRCFISSPTGATPAKSFFMVLDDDNTATDVRHLESDTEADIKSGRYPFYSIDGKLMGNDYDALECGQMYIVNGKKFYKF